MTEQQDKDRTAPPAAPTQLQQQQQQQQKKKTSAEHRRNQAVSQSISPTRGAMLQHASTTEDDAVNVAGTADESSVPTSAIDTTPAHPQNAVNAASDAEVGTEIKGEASLGQHASRLKAQSPAGTSLSVSGEKSSSRSSAPRPVSGSSAERLATTRNLDESVKAWAASGGVLWYEDRLEAGPWTTLIDGPLRTELLVNGTKQVFPHSPAWRLDNSGFMPRVEPLSEPPKQAPTVLVPAGRTLVTIKAALDWYRRGVARIWLHEPTGWEITELEPLLCELLYLRRVRPMLRRVFPGLILNEAAVVAMMASRLRIQRRRRFGLQYAGAFLPDLGGEVAQIAAQVQAVRQEQKSKKTGNRGPATTGRSDSVAGQKSLSSAGKPPASLPRPRRAHRSTTLQQLDFAPGGPALWVSEIKKDNDALRGGVTQREKTVSADEPGRMLASLPKPDQPLRVMHYIGSLNSGGAERQLCNLAIGLNERGHDVRVRTAYEMTGELGHYLPLLEEGGIDAVHASAERAIAQHAAERASRLRKTEGGHGGAEPNTNSDHGHSAGEADDDADRSIVDAGSRALRWDLLAAVPDHLRPLVMNLACELIVFRPHVVHAWLDHPNMIAGMAGLIAGAPRILFSTRNSNPTNFPRLHSPELDLWYRTLTPSDRIHWLANSHSGAASYADYVGVPVDKIHVVLNGVFRGHFTPPDDQSRSIAREKFGLPADAPVVAIVNRLSEEKQPELALKVISMVRSDLPDLRVLFAGAGPLEDRLREILRNRNMQDCVQMLGRVRNVDSIFLAADCLLLTSTLEGCPNVALEAQHVGIPVVATAGGGTIDAVVDGRTGFLCGVTDAAGLTIALRRVLQDAGLRRTFGRDAQTFVDACFSVDQMVDLTCEVYRSMVESNGHRDEDYRRVVTPKPALCESADAIENGAIAAAESMAAKPALNGSSSGAAKAEAFTGHIPSTENAAGPDLLPLQEVRVRRSHTPHASTGSADD
ncbi:MAG: glycosyltransferase family 4 protein [Planctomycetota bacterium]